MRLNDARKILLVAYSLGVLACLLYVPWTFPHDLGFAGYAFIWDAGNPHLALILLELLGLTLVTGALWILLGDADQRPAGTRGPGEMEK